MTKFQITEEALRANRETFMQELCERYEGNLLQAFLAQIPSANSVRKRRYNLQRFFGNAHISVKDAQRVTTEEVLAFQQQLLQRGLRPISCKNQLRDLSVFFKFLRARGIVETNPAAPRLLRSFNREESRRPQVDPLSAHEVRLLLAAASGSDQGHNPLRNQALLASAFFGALHRKEVRGMDAEHLEWDRGLLLHIPKGFGGRPGRVWLPQGVGELIRDLQEQCGLWRGSLWRDMRFTVGSDRLSAENLHRVLRRITEAAGITKRVTFPSLRVSFRQLAEEAGISQSVCAAHMRQATVGGSSDEPVSPEALGPKIAERLWQHVMDSSEER